MKRLALSLVLVACHSVVAADPGEPPIRPEPITDAQPDAPAALVDHAWLEPIGDDARELGQVSVPLGATEPRPVILALHGAQDRAEWSCGEWRGVTAAYPFILCPRGDASRLYYDAPKKTASDIRLALDLLRNRYAPFVEDGEPSVMVGFSMGAAEALALVVQTDLRVSALALVEGGYDSLALAGVPSILRARSVERVLLACTTLGWCPAQYAKAKPALEKAGITVRYVQAAAKTHGMYPEVTEALAHEMAFLTSRGPRP